MQIINSGLGQHVFSLGDYGDAKELVNAVKSVVELGIPLSAEEINKLLIKLDKQLEEHKENSVKSKGATIFLGRKFSI